MDKQQINELSIQQLTEWRKYPMLAKTGHGITRQPFQRKLLQSRVHVEYKKLKFNEKIIPIRHRLPQLWLKPTVQRTVSQKSRIKMGNQLME